MVRRVKRRGKTRRELLAREDEFRRLREERAKLVEVNGAEPPRVPALPPPARPGAPHAGEPRPEPDGRALTERWLPRLFDDGPPGGGSPGVKPPRPKPGAPLRGSPAREIARARAESLARDASGELQTYPKPHASAGRRAAAAAANKLPRVKAALALAGGASPGGGLGSPERWRKTVSPTVRAPRNGDPFSNLAPGGHFPAPGGGKPTTFEAALAPALLGPLGSKRPLERAPSLKKPAPPPPRAAAAPREKTPQLAAPLVVAAVPRGLPDEYRLCWQDVFDYEGVPHPSRWEYQCDANDWIHDERHCEAQWYTDKLDNACVRDGRLRIIARLERSHGCRYTSARLRTKHRGDWLYGRVEVRARLPPSRRGLWPAIWMLPTDDAFGGWPHSGEIDIMEHVGWEQDGLIHAAAHSTKHNPCVGHQRSQSKLVPTAHRGFHTYAMNWTPKALEIFVDNGLALRVEDKGRGPGDWPYSKRFHLLLNLAIGGWGGQYGIDDTAFPACLEVDSVRVFQRSWRESEPEQ